MRRCRRCVLPDTYPRISFDGDGICNVCANHRPFTPIPEKKLLAQFDAARKRRKAYDALVPLSGGKDSTYVLWLATRVYRLRVLAFTFDNGFLTDVARRNISNALEAAETDHVLYKPSWEFLRRLYRAHLLRTGELCTVCTLGIVSSYTRTALMYSIPLVLTGNTLMEESSGTGEDNYDQVKFRAITRGDGGVSEQELRRELIWPQLGLVGRRVYLRMRRTAKVVSPLYYRPRATEDEMATVVGREMGWMGHDERDHGKHIDCLAEPLSTRIRVARFGYSRKDAQYSTLVRIGEMERDAALQVLEGPRGDIAGATSPAMDRLGLTEKELQRVLEVPVHSYASARSLEARILRTAYNTAARNKRLFGVARAVWRRL